MLSNESNMPYVSIIVCAYNEEKFIESCIDSLINQDYPKSKYELIVVDDGSTDKTPDICGDFIQESSIEMKYVRIKHAGLSIARNVGILFSEGDIISFIDADAIAQKTWLSAIVETFQKDDDIGIVAGKIDILNRTNKIALMLHYGSYCRYANGKEIIPLIGANMSFRRKVFEAHNGFFKHFESRGDECVFLQKFGLESLVTISKGNLEKMESAPNAIVFHERPKTLNQWLHERANNGRFLALAYVTLKKRCLLNGRLARYHRLILLAPWFPIIRAFLKIPLKANLLRRHLRPKYVGLMCLISPLGTMLEICSYLFWRYKYRGILIQHTDDNIEACATYVEQIYENKVATR